jgi:hypothetical protein
VSPPEPARDEQREHGGADADRGGDLPRWLAPVVAGAGLAIGVTGAVLLVWSRATYDTIRESGCAPSCDPDRVDGPKHLQTVGGVLLVAGGAAAVGGVVLWLTRSPQASRAAKWIGPGSIAF